MRMHASLTLGLILLESALLAAPKYTYVPVPGANNCIQTNLISTFPEGALTADNKLATPFNIATVPATCGYTGTGACNFFDAFGFIGVGDAITIDVSIRHVTHVYTLMNAYSPPPGAQLATIEFAGEGGATNKFALVAGQNIRDFYNGDYANTLTNGISGVRALNAFKCGDPHTCLGAGGTGNVNTGEKGSYRIDEQEFTLSSEFATQKLVRIILTDTHNGADPMLLGITAKSK
jgi:hypothetical protein